MRFSIVSIASIICGFLLIKLLMFIGIISNETVSFFLEALVFIAFSMASYFYFLKKRKAEHARSEYAKRLTQTLIDQSHNELFYTGDTIKGSMILMKEVAINLCTDLSSIWLYDDDRTKITCQQIYMRADDSFNSGTELFKDDFLPYFEALQKDQIIVADHAETHPATSCFLKSYLLPLGIKSMLDVPIWFRGEIIGVICIESYTHRSWKKEEINFLQLLSSLYSFAFSIKEGNQLTQNLIEMEQFIDAAALISKADSQGKITYVNDKFTKVSGWTLEDALGQDHSIVNAGQHSRAFWQAMYRKTIEEKKIWNAVVTNRAKNGELYYVDTYIKADFDRDSGALEGFVSMRQDVTQIINTLNELDKKNTYLEHAAKILRHDMHSGINTYIPRGISSLERRLTPEVIQDLKLESPLKMVKEGLKHTQKVYTGVYEFTNLVKKDVVLTKTECNIKTILEEYLASTSYKSQVILDESLPTLEVNESLFCTAIDNLIRNGLKYNDSPTKVVRVFFEKSRKRFGLSKRYIIVEDNGRGLDQEDFEKLSKPYARREGQKEAGSGLGLNICRAILSEHGFDISAEKLKEGGTKLKIRIAIDGTANK